MKWRMVSAWMALMLLVTAAVPALAEESAPAVMTAGEQFTDGDMTPADPDDATAQQGEGYTLQDGVLTVTAEADFAALTGTLGGIRTLKAQGIDTIVFVTNGATSTFALSDLLAQGGDGYTLTHDGAAVTFTMTDGADVSKILQ